MRLIEHERQSVFASPPRRNSEEWHEQQSRIGSGVAFIDDTWLYRWNERGAPPEPFRLHKTLFRQCALSEISKNGWTTLKLAVGDLSDVFNVRLRDSDFKTRSGQRPTYQLEWLLLNRYYRCPCILGIYGEEYVVAAAKVSQKRFPFIPFNLYKVFHQHPVWKNLRYQAGYRHFQAQFDIGYSFCAEQRGLPCVLTYRVDVGVHSCASIWAILDIGGILLPAPYRLPLKYDLSDLSGKIERINKDCLHFVHRLGASYLRASDADSVYKLISHYIRNTDVPHCVREDLRTDPRLDRCLTRLDVLLVTMKAMNLRLDDDSIPSLISLTQKFCPPNTGE